MTHTLHLPALDGRDPLGFLASLGLLRLLAEDGADVRLSFSEETATAVLHGPYGSADEVAAVLHDVAARNPDSVIPGIPAGFPLAKIGTKGSDPMRVGRDEYRGHVETVRQSVGQAALLASGHRHGPCLRQRGQGHTDSVLRSQRPADRTLLLREAGDNGPQGT